MATDFDRSCRSSRRPFGCLEILIRRQAAIPVHVDQSILKYFDDQQLAK